MWEQALSRNPSESALFWRVAATGVRRAAFERGKEEKEAQKRNHTKM